MSVALQAIYKKHSTTVDGGIILSFDLPEDQGDAVNQVYKLKGEPLYLVVLTEAEYSAKSLKR